MGDGAGPEYAGEVGPGRPRGALLRLLRSRARDPLIILPYLGFGTRSRVILSGRVLQDEGFRPAATGERRWRNLVAFVKRMESDEVPFARLSVLFQEKETSTLADREGYFRAEIAPSSPLEPGWHEVKLRLADRPGIEATGEVLVPPPAARFAVVSDIDDTIVRTDVLRKVRMVLGIALANARTRKPFEGVGALYRALAAGGNPLFYVSKSPWNLYAPIVDFLQHQAIPKGPLLLRDFSMRMPENHKREAIESILAMYPALHFVLIGDSGEQDPEIYAELVHRFPRRIRAIYIRSIDPAPRRLAALALLAAEVAKTGCQLVVAADSEAAALHAAGEGLIAPGALADVRRERLADRAAPRTATPPAAR